MLTISDEGGLEWIVNWDEFNGGKKISDVKATLYDTDAKIFEYVTIDQWANVQAASIIRKCDYNRFGTVFCLEGLHDDWDKNTMDHLRNHLENLLPPDVAKDFSVFFFDDTTSAEDIQIISKSINTFDYKIHFMVDKDSLKIHIVSNEFDISDNQRLLNQIGFSPKEQEYLCGEEHKLSFSIEKELEQPNCIGRYNGTLGDKILKNHTSK